MTLMTFDMMWENMRLYYGTDIHEAMRWNWHEAVLWNLHSHQEAASLV